MKAKMALEKQLQEMRDLDRLLYEALQSQASDANAGSLKESWCDRRAAKNCKS